MKSAECFYRTRNARIQYIGDKCRVSVRFSVVGVHCHSLVLLPLAVTEHISGFNGTPRTDFLGSTAVDNLSGLRLPAHATRESSFRGNYEAVTEPEVNAPFVHNKIVKPTGVTATMDGLLSGISLSSLLSSRSGYTPSLPARFGPFTPQSDVTSQEHIQHRFDGTYEAYGIPRQPQPERE